MIQTNDIDGNWMDFDNPSFGASPHRHRIKPEPQKSYVTQLSFSESMPNVDYSKLKSVSIGGIEFIPAAMLEKVSDVRKYLSQAISHHCLTCANGETMAGK